VRPRTCCPAVLEAVPQPAPRSSRSTRGPRRRVQVDESPSRAPTAARDPRRRLGHIAPSSRCCREAESATPTGARAWRQLCSWTRSTARGIHRPQRESRSTSRWCATTARARRVRPPPSPTLLRRRGTGAFAAATVPPRSDPCGRRERCVVVAAARTAAIPSTRARPDGPARAATHGSALSSACRRGSATSTRGSPDLEWTPPRPGRARAAGGAVTTLDRAPLRYNHARRASNRISSRSRHRRAWALF